MKLTDTQMQILAAAAEQPDRMVKPPAIPPGPRGALEAKLRSAGLIEQLRLGAEDQPAMAWRHAEGEAIGYRITKAGLLAVGVETSREVDIPSSGPGEAAEGNLPPAAIAEAGDSAAPPATAPESKAGLASTPARLALRAAALAVLTTWDNEADGRAGLDAAIAALRITLATKPARMPRSQSASRKPREGTKQQQILELLRRPEGATIAQIAEITGWQAHTVRGFFAGLRKRQGITVEVLERVRQVGPGTHGAKGSYSIYRIADAG
jgi:hypothetical protein